MARELLFLALSVLWCGSALWGVGWRVAPDDRAAPASTLERQRWRALWRPAVIAGVVLSVLLGWVLVEPAHAEPLPWTFAALGAAVAAIWLRAIVRAIRAARVGAPLVGAFGLVAPRIYIAPRVRAALGPEELAAVQAHEEAHVRHRDPARIWVAQLVTDLQWPARPARLRLRRWLDALELARDEEARRGGADGATLATAILTTIRIGAATSAPAVAPLTDGRRALRERIERLLAPLPRAERTSATPRWRRWLAYPSACGLGMAFGEIVIGVVLRVVP